MVSVVWGFALDFWSRHRVVLLLALGFLLLLVVLSNGLPAGTVVWDFVMLCTLPLWFVVLYLITGFSHGDQAELETRASGYPRRLFTLPVRTTALVGWPLAIGAVSGAFFCLVLGGLVLHFPWQVQVPLAVFLTALLCWLQALAWCPFPLPYLRVIVAGPVLGGMVSGAILGFALHVSPEILLVVYAGLIPVGYVVAVAGVARARRGDTPVWNWPLLQGRESDRVLRAAEIIPFSSKAEAQFWAVTGHSGIQGPLLVISFLILPSLMLFHLVEDPNAAALVLLGLGLYPVVLVTGGGAAMGNCHPSLRSLSTMPAFIAARPVTSAEILAVQIRVAAHGIVFLWAMIFLFQLAIVPFSRAGGVLIGWMHNLIAAEGVKGWALLLLFVVGPPLLTWKWGLDQLWIGLTGRRALMAILPMSLVWGGLALFLAGRWVFLLPAAHDAFLAILPWVVGFLLLLKLGGGVLVARLLLHRGLVAAGTLTRFAVVWILAAAGLFGLTYWLMPPEVCSPLVVGGAAVLLGLPLVRLGLAPLALDWNRHR